jgi:hypothetical protein
MQFYPRSYKLGRLEFLLSKVFWEYSIAFDVARRATPSQLACVEYMYQLHIPVLLFKFEP